MGFFSSKDLFQESISVWETPELTLYITGKGCVLKTYLTKPVLESLTLTVKIIFQIV